MKADEWKEDTEPPPEDCLTTKVLLTIMCRPTCFSNFIQPYHIVYSSPSVNCKMHYTDAKGLPSSDPKTKNNNVVTQVKTFVYACKHDVKQW